MVILLALSPCSTSCAAKPDAAGAVSQFAKEVAKAKDKYKETAPPAAPLFRWDFSKANVVHTYAYEHEVRSKMDMGALGGGVPETGQEMSGKGVLLIKSQGDKTAELVLKDMKVTLKVDLGQDEPKTMKPGFPG